MNQNIIGIKESKGKQSLNQPTNQPCLNSILHVNYKLCYMKSCLDFFPCSVIIPSSQQRMTQGAFCRILEIEIII